MKPFVWLMLLALMPLPLWAQQRREVSVESVIYDLKNPDSARRKVAAQTLGQNKVRSAVPALLEASQDQDGSVRLEVIRALVEINDPRALSAYVNATNDEATEIREKSIVGMVNLYVVEEGGFIRTTKKIIDALNPFDVDYDNLVVEPYVPVSAEAITALSNLIADPETRIRKRAAQAVGVLRGEEAAPILIDQLVEETDPETKVQIIRAIGKLGQSEYGTVLVPFIEDENKAVHDEAIRTVGLLKVDDAVESLTRLYNIGPEERRRVFKIIPASGKDDLQIKLLDALALIAAPQSQSIFAHNLHHKEPEFRRIAAEGLGRVGLKQAGAELPLREESVTLLQNQKKEEAEPEVRLAIDFALYRLGSEALLAELINGLDSARYEQALQYLLELSPEETPKLFVFVRLNRKRVQLGLLTALGNVGGADALPHLQELSMNKDLEIASAANEAMRRLNARIR